MSKLVLFFSFVCLSQIAFAQPAFTSLGDSIPATILREVFKNTRITEKFKGFFLLNIETGETPHLIIHVWTSSEATLLVKYPPSAIIYHKGFPFVIYTGIEHLIKPDSATFNQTFRGVWSRLYSEERWNEILAHYNKTGHGEAILDDSPSLHFFYYGSGRGSLQLFRTKVLGQTQAWPRKWLPKPGPPQDR